MSCLVIKLRKLVFFGLVFASCSSDGSSCVGGVWQRSRCQGQAPPEIADVFEEVDRTDCIGRNCGIGKTLILSDGAGQVVSVGLVQHGTGRVGQLGSSAPARATAYRIILLLLFIVSAAVTAAPKDRIQLALLDRGALFVRQWFRSDLVDSKSVEVDLRLQHRLDSIHRIDLDHFVGERSALIDRESIAAESLFGFQRGSELARRRSPSETTVDHSSDTLVDGKKPIDAAHYDRVRRGLLVNPLLDGTKPVRDGSPRNMGASHDQGVRLVGGVETKHSDAAFGAVSDIHNDLAIEPVMSGRGPQRGQTLRRSFVQEDDGIQSLDGDGTKRANHGLQSPAQPGGCCKQSEGDGPVKASSGFDGESSPERSAMTHRDADDVLLLEGDEVVELPHGVQRGTQLRRFHVGLDGGYQGGSHIEEEELFATDHGLQSVGSQSLNDHVVVLTETGHELQRASSDTSSVSQDEVDGAHPLHGEAQIKAPLRLHHARRPGQSRIVFEQNDTSSVLVEESANSKAIEARSRDQRSTGFRRPTANQSGDGGWSLEGEESITLSRGLQRGTQLKRPIAVNHEVNDAPLMENVGAHIVDHGQRGTTSRLSEVAEGTHVFEGDHGVHAGQSWRRGIGKGHHEGIPTKDLHQDTGSDTASGATDDRGNGSLLEGDAPIEGGLELQSGTKMKRSRVVHTMFDPLEQQEGEEPISSGRGLQRGTSLARSFAKKKVEEDPSRIHLAAGSDRLSEAEVDFIEDDRPIMGGFGLQHGTTMKSSFVVDRKVDGSDSLRGEEMHLEYMEPIGGGRGLQRSMRINRVVAGRRESDVERDELASRGKQSFSGRGREIAFGADSESLRAGRGDDVGLTMETPSGSGGMSKQRSSFAVREEVSGCQRGSGGVGDEGIMTRCNVLGMHSHPTSEKGRLGHRKKSAETASMGMLLGLQRGVTVRTTAVLLHDDTDRNDNLVSSIGDDFEAGVFGLQRSTVIRRTSWPREKEGRNRRDKYQESSTAA